MTTSSFLLLASPDNIGKEFIIGFMDNEGAIVRKLQCTDYELDLFIGTSSSATVQVNVTAPRYRTAGLREHFTIHRNSVKHLKLHCHLRNFGTSLSSKGVLIQASDEIFVSGINRQQFSADGFLALPTDVLGMITLLEIS